MHPSTRCLPGLDKKASQYTALTCKVNALAPVLPPALHSGAWKCLYALFQVYWTQSQEAAEACEAENGLVAFEGQNCNYNLGLGAPHPVYFLPDPAGDAGTKDEDPEPSLMRLPGYFRQVCQQIQERLAVVVLRNSIQNG